MKIINNDEYLAKESETLKEHTEKVVKCVDDLHKLKYLDDDLYYKIREAAQYHDIGKANTNFQTRLRDGTKFDLEKEVPHNIVSYFLANIIKDNIDDITNYAIINHHHYQDNYKLINKFINDNSKINKFVVEINDILKSNSIDIEKNSSEDELQDNIEFLAIKATCMRERIVNKINNNKFLDESAIKYIIALGILNKCDYSASADIPVEYDSDFLEKKLEDMMERWPKDNNWNELQEYCKDEDNKNKNIIAVAPTGMGKTEAALLWIGNSKGFFVLPLKTAINSIYKRVVEDVLCNKDVDKRVSLLHSDTFSSYKSLIDSNSSIHNKNDDSVSNVIDYYERSKNLSIPLNITTPDQIFDFVFKHSGYEYKYAMMSYSKVVIDEIQSYNAELLAILVLSIQNIIDIGGKVAIFTATFPPFIKNLLEKRKRYGNKIDKYNFESTYFESDNKRHNFVVVGRNEAEKREINADDIIEHYKNNQSEYKKYLIVCNTVKKAQEIYNDMKEKGFNNVNIFHSKFNKIDRNKKESHIINTGKTYADVEKSKINNADEIWISTQVVEASLDIDFDYLFTELSDLNGLFQRFGRVNRKGVKSVEEPNIFIYTEINPKIIKTSSEGTGFIDKGIYQLSKKALLSRPDGIISETEKQELINEYFTTEKLEKEESVFYNDYWQHYSYYAELYQKEIDINSVKRTMRNIVSFNVFPVNVEQNAVNFVNEKEIEKLVDDINEIRVKLSDLSRKMKELKNSYRDSICITLKDKDSENKPKNKIDTDSKYSDYISKKSKLEDDKKSLLMQYMSKKDEIMKYTVSVGMYDMKYKVSGDTGTVELSKHNVINKVYCHYDDAGFRRLNKQSFEGMSDEIKNKIKLDGNKYLESKENDEDFDSFI